MNNKKNILSFLAIFIFLSLFLIPGFCSAAWKLNAGYPPLPFAPTLNEGSRLPDYIAYLFFAGVYIAGVLAIISIAVGGIQLISSAENPDRINNARDRIKNSVIGLVLLMASVIIMSTINPNLRQLGVTVPIKEPSGLWLVGPGGKTSAPDEVADISQQYAGKYTTLKWPDKISDINGKTYDNCPDKNVYAYMVYVYKNSNYSGVIDYGELKCGSGEINVAQGQSYTAVKEYPGVYIYKNSKGCGPIAGSNDLPETAKTVSEPDIPKSRWHDNIYSVRIINGPDANGPFYGVVLFGASGYLGRGVWIYDTGNSYGNYPNNISNCKQLEAWYGYWALTEAGSALIYKHAIYDTSSGPGITLYSRRDADVGGGARYCPDDHPNDCIIRGSDFGSKPMIDVDLSEAKVNYYVNGSPIPWDEQQACLYFAGSDNKINDCFQSMKIDGNFLVILDNFGNETTNGTLISNSCWWYYCYTALPKPGASFGPTDLNQSGLDPSARNYLKIIPLAGPLFPPGTKPLQ